jgi:hypothetical protein
VLGAGPRTNSSDLSMLEPLMSGSCCYQINTTGALLSWRHYSVTKNFISISWMENRLDAFNN